MAKNVITYKYTYILPKNVAHPLTCDLLSKIKNVLLLQVDDHCVLEFAALTLSELAREPSGCGQLVSANILGVLLDRMENCPDPDVQNNCLHVGSSV